MSVSDQNILNQMKLPREDALLLACLNAESNKLGMTQEEFSLSDWDLVVKQSLKHRVAPLLHRHLKSLGRSPNIPPGIMGRLEQTYLETAGKNVRLFHELSKVLNILKHDGIPVIVLKGAHLAELVYEDLGLRGMGDVDLLFRLQDLSRAQEKLAEHGYLPHNRALSLDLHWNIALSSVPLPINIEDTWERSQPAVIAQEEVLVFCVEDLLLHLCLHLCFQHLFKLTGLRYLYDIYETIRRYHGRIGWEQIADRATQWRAGNAIYVALRLASELTGCPVPDQIMKSLKPHGSSYAVRAWALRQIFEGTDDEPSLNPRFCVLWSSRPIKEKIAYSLRLVFPSAPLMSQTYQTKHGSMRNYVSYFLHIKKNFFEYADALLGVLTGDKEVLNLIDQQNQNTAIREWLTAR